MCVLHAMCVMYVCVMRVLRCACDACDVCVCVYVCVCVWRVCGRDVCLCVCVWREPFPVTNDTLSQLPQSRGRPPPYVRVTLNKTSASWLRCIPCAGSFPSRNAEPSDSLLPAVPWSGLLYLVGDVGQNPCMVLRRNRALLFENRPN